MDFTYENGFLHLNCRRTYSGVYQCLLSTSINGDISNGGHKIKRREFFTLFILYKEDVKRKNLTLEWIFKFNLHCKLRVFIVIL